MKTYIISFLALSLFACHKGDFDEECNKDGTCNSPNLECGGLNTSNYNGRCGNKRTHEQSESAESKFCDMCIQKCGAAGLKACNWSDVSVWGAKPATCECK